MLEANYTHCGTHWKAIADDNGIVDIYVCSRASGSNDLGDWVKVGCGSWVGTNIESAVILPNEIYEGLDSGLRAAQGAAGKKIPASIICPHCNSAFFSRE